MSKKITIIGLDIGGTKIYGARFNQYFKVEQESKFPTEAKKGKKQVLKNIISVLKKIIDPKSTKAIGISWAGLINSEKGIIRFAPNIPGFKNIPLAKIISQKFSLPTFIENDAKLFTLAEARQGVAKNLPHVVGIIIGTGIGSGIIVNHELYHGADGFAGELGHCFFSTPKTIEIEKELAGPALNKYSQARFNLPFEELIKNTKARQFIIKKLALFIYNLTLLHNPSTVVFGGGIGQNVLPLIAKNLTKEVHTLLKKRNYDLRVNLKFSRLKNGGALGAALLAQEKFNK